MEKFGKLYYSKVCLLFILWFFFHNVLILVFSNQFVYFTVDVLHYNVYHLTMILKLKREGIYYCIFIHPLSISFSFSYENQFYFI